MQNRVNFEFETLGQLQMEDAVVGIVYTDTGDERLVVTVLTQDMGANKRKSKLDTARQQLNNKLVSVGVPTNLMDSFKTVSAQQTKGSISSAEHAGSLIQYMLSETNQPIIILDCQNKPSFWTALRTLGVDKDTMFSLAELEALKPEHSSRKEVKSVGIAHELCRALSKKTMGEDSTINDKEAIQFIKKASKYKLPKLDITKERRVAMTNQMRVATSNKSLKFVANMLKMVPKIFGGNKSPENKDQSMSNQFFEAITDTPYNQAELTGMQKQLKEISEGSMSGALESIVSAFEQGGDGMNIFSELKEEDFEYPLLQVSQYGHWEINIREGYHFLRNKKCLFEFEANYGKEEESLLTCIVLSEQVDDEINLHFFYREPEDKDFSVGYHGGLIKLDEDMGITEWQMIDLKTNESVGGTGRSKVSITDTASQLVPIQIAHIMNTVARMNEPDYEVTTIVPTGGAVSRSRKHGFPYFAYDVVDEPLKPTHIRTVSNRPEEQTRSSPLYHKVSRHTRVLDRGTDKEHVTIIPEHYRGDITKGVKSRTTFAQPR